MNKETYEGNLQKMINGIPDGQIEKLWSDVMLLKDSRFKLNKYETVTLLDIIHELETILGDNNENS